jgi:MoaA/NifB/PqqE/SkfB family radical SAM enzyme
MAFCRLPWQGLMITPLGDFRLCALTNGLEYNQGMSTDEDGKLMNILTHSPNDGLNGKWHREVRQNDVKTDGSWHDICSCCRDREIATGSDIKHIAASRRQSMERRNPSTHIVDGSSYKDVKMDENGYVDWMPTTLDIRFGNLCNMACVQCGPNYSNKWYEDWVGFYGENAPWGFGRSRQKLTRNDHGKLVNLQEKKWWETDIWWDKFDQMLPTLEHIYLTGGEPMIVPAHDEMLDRIIASGRAKDVYLDYDTNLSVINTKLAKRWDHFKHVEIAGSIDASEDNYEFVRHGGKWETFDNNVTRIKEFEKNGIVKLYRLTACMQPTTIFSILQTEQYCTNKGIPFQIRFVDSPKMHSIMSLPRSAKEEIIEIYSKVDTITSRLVVEWTADHLDEKHESPDDVKRYVRIMNYLDTSRGTDWKVQTKGTWELLNRHCDLGDLK